MDRSILLILLFFWIPFGDIYGQFFEVEKSIILEEKNGIFISSPRFQETTGKEILVVDQEAHRVSVYDTEGELINYFGRYGRGPGDLEKPTSAIKLPTGEYLVSEFKGRISKFDAEGKFQTVTEAGIPRLNGLKLLPNGKVLLVGGMTRPEEHFLLHLFDPATMEVKKAFFELPLDPSEYAMQPLTLAESSFAVICENKIIAVHTMLPKLFYFDLMGNATYSVEIELDNFNPMEKHSNSSNPRIWMELYGSASYISGLHCLDNGSILLQYFQNLKMEGNPLVVALMSKEGILLQEYVDSPQIKFSHSETDTIFIDGMNSGQPNIIQKAKVLRN